MQNSDQAENAREFRAVNHPTPGEWMSYLYGELSSAGSASLTAHLRGCADCRVRLAGWRAAQSGLAQWHLDGAAGPLRPRSARPALNWALAALIVLGLGYTLGRLAEKTGREPTRAALATAVRQQVENELKADLQAVFIGTQDALNTPFRRELRSAVDRWNTRSVAATKAETGALLLTFAEQDKTERQRDQRTVLTLLDRLEQQHQAEYINLRRALETVALVADDKFERTETQIDELANYAETRMISN
jgi:hypothetical protein